MPSLVIQFEQMDSQKQFDQMMSLLQNPSHSATLRTHISMTIFDWNIQQHPPYQEWIASGRKVFDSGKIDEGEAPSTHSTPT